MGDTYQTIALPRVTQSMAAEVAESLRDHLVERGIMVRATSDCVLGGVGHAPGPNRCDAIFEGDVEVHRALDRLVTNGVLIEFGARKVFHARDLDQVHCPNCDSASEPQDGFMEHIEAWFKGRDPHVTCPSCGSKSSLPEWRTQPPWAFGYLGLTFWNWPQLSLGFIESLESIAGSSAVVIRDKL